MLDGFALHEIICDPSGKPIDYRFLAVNPAFERMTGLKAEDVVGHTVLEALPGKETYWIETYGKVALSGEPILFEDYTAVFGKYFEVTAFRPAPGRFACIFQDITERKKAEEALRESEKKYRLLTENSLQGMVIAQSDPVRLAYASKPMEKITGYSIEELENFGVEKLTNLIHPDDRPRFFKNFSDRLNNIQVDNRAEYRIIRKNGDVAWIEIFSSLIEHKGSPATQTLFIDITERKQAEEKLRESEEKYRLLADNQADVIWTRDFDLNLTYISPSTFRQTGFTVAERMKQSFSESVTPKSYALTLKVVKEEMELEKRGDADPNRSRMLEIDMYRKDGSIFTVEITVNFLRDENGAAIGLMGVSRDITERKRAEEELKQLNERFVLATDSAKIGVWDLDLIENTLTWDDRMLQLYGVDRDNFTGAYDAWQKGVHPDDLEQADKEVQQAITGEKEFDTEFRIVLPNKEVRHLKAYGQVIRDQSDTPVRMIGVNFDITERKQAEESYRREMERNQQYLDVAGVMILALNTEGIVTLVNQQGCKILNGQESEIVGKNWFDQFLPESVIEQTKHVFAKLISGNAEVFEYFEQAILTCDKQERTIAWHNVLLHDEKGNISGTLSSGEDVTEQRASEAALQEAVLRQQEAVKAGNIGLWDWDLRTNQVYYSVEWKKQIGYEDHEITNSLDEWQDRVHPDDLDAALESIDTMIKEVRLNHRIEFRFRHKDGSYRWIYSRASVHTDENGVPVRVFGSHSDVTEIKQAEEALIESERQKHLILNSTVEVISYYSTDLRLIWGNHALAKTIGQPLEQLAGKHCFDFWYDCETPCEDCRIFEVLDNKKPQFLEKQSKDGSYWHIRRYPIIEESGVLAAFVEFRQDITEQKKAELLLRESEQQKNLILNSSAEMIAYYDTDLRVIWANFASAVSVDKTPEELIGQHCYEIWQHRDTPCEGCPVLKAFETKTDQQTEQQTPDGRYWYLRGYPVLDDDENVIALVEFGQDITDRKLAENKLRESEERFRSIAEQSSYLISLTDNKGFINYASPASREIFGVEPHDMIGKHFTEFLNEVSVPLAVSEFEKSLKDGKRIRSLELVMKRKNGDTFYGELSGTLFESSFTSGTLVVINDITARKEAENALIESERKFRNVITQSNDAIYILADGKFDLINPRFTELTGCTEEEVRLESFDIFDLVAPEDRDIIKERMKKRELGIEPNQVYEFTIIHKNGSRVRVQTSVTEVDYKDGRATLGVLRNITDQHKAEMALRESEENLRRLTDTMQETMSVINLGGDFLYANLNTVQNMTGSKEEEIIGKNIREFLPEDQVEDLIKRYREVYNSGKTSQAEVPVHLPAGEKWFLNTLKPIDYGHPPVQAVLSVSLDITEQKQAIDSLFKSEAKFRSVIEQSNDAIYILFNDRFDLFNERFLSMTGLSIKEVEDKNFTLKQTIHKDDIPLIEERKRRIEAGEEVPHVYSFRIVNSDGTLKDVQASDSSIKYKDGTATLGILRDTTEARILEEQLRQAQKIESIGHLAGGVAHDFNNLLTPILGNTELALMHMDSSDPLYEDIKQIAETADRAKDLTRQLLAFSRKQVLDVKTVDLNTLIENFRKILRRTIREDIKLTVKYNSDIHPVSVDISQIEQILMNLSVNAQDAMPDGGTLSIETNEVELDKDYAATHPGTIPGLYTQLIVSDTGTGMDENTRQSIFDPFFTTKEVGKGTGLGLSTVYGIVKQHNGSIWVYSELGHGTTFKLYFPALPSHEKESKQLQNDLEKYIGNESILVVEDDSAVRKIAERFLKNYGYNVYVAEDGDKALRFVNEEHPEIDLLITDVIMPKLNGRQVHGILSGIFPNLKVLYMSGYTQDIISQHGVLEKGIDFIQKPLDLKSFIAKVREILDK